MGKGSFLYIFFIIYILFFLLSFLGLLGDLNMLLIVKKGTVKPLVFTNLVCDCVFRGESSITTSYPHLPRKWVVPLWLFGNTYQVKTCPCMRVSHCFEVYSVVCFCSFHSLQWRGLYVSTICSSNKMVFRSQKWKGAPAHPNISSLQFDMDIQSLDSQCLYHLIVFGSVHITIFLSLYGFRWPRGMGMG